MKVLVTGAGGFIGSHLTEHLIRQGHEVRALVHYRSQDHLGWLEDLPDNLQNEVDFQRGDVRDADQMRRIAQGCQVLFHLAALIGIPYSYQAPASYIQTNVTGTLNLLLAAREHGCRVVQTSTSEVYGSPKSLPISEEAPLQAQSPYAASKTAADQLALSFFHSYDLPVCVVRPFNTYGPRQSRRAIIPTLLSQLLSGAEVLRLGSLSPIRDFNYVQDTVEGMLQVGLCDHALGRATNLGSGVGISIGELAQRCAALVDRPIRIEHDPQRVRPDGSEVSQLICDAGQAKHQCGWSSTTEIDTGLQRTFAWFKENLRADETPRYWT